MAKRRWPALLWRWLLISLLSLVLLSFGSVLAMRFINPITSSFMVRDRLIAWVSGDREFRFSHDWVSWSSISPHMKVAVIASEDQKFPEHHGFDVESMEKAWQANRRGKRIRGGSTISQQVAKNLYLWPGQSYVRKAVEAWLTLLIEGLWPKERILEIYLNSAEFGKGVFGVGAASQRFFGKPAARLTPSEAALLAAVLPAPKRLLVNRPSAFVRARQNWIVGQMNQLGGPALLQSL